MSIHLFRTSFSLAVIAFSTMAVGTADAKECKTDQDCASGFECLLREVNGGAGSGGNTGSTEGSTGAGAAVGSACVGPDCPVSSDPVPPPNPSSQPADGVPPKLDIPLVAPGDGGAAVPPSKPGDVYDPIAPITTGVCRPKVLVCSSKADCPANLDCVKETGMVKRAPCAPDDTSCDTSLPVSETGTCKAVCSVDSDCPAPLVCKLQGQSCMGGGSMSKDGTVTTIPTTCTGGNRICTYEPVTCSTNAECKDSNYQCAKIYETQSCSGAAPAMDCPRSKGDADLVCTPTPVEPPVCTSVTVNNCMPKEIKCDAGEACPTGWSCFDLTNFDEGTMPGWSTPMPSKACMPDGLILAIKGQASGGASTTYGSSPTRDGNGSIGQGEKGGPGGPATTGGDLIPPQVTPVPASDGHDNAAVGDAGAEAASTKVRGGGCSLGGAQDGAFGLLAFGLVGLALRLVRRRR